MKLLSLKTNFVLLLCINLGIHTQIGEYVLSKGVKCMDHDDLEKDNRPNDNSKKTKKETREKEKMAVIERELKEMQKLQQKRKLTREQLRKALIKETIKDNYEALQRLSRT